MASRSDLKAVLGEDFTTTTVPASVLPKAQPETRRMPQPRRFKKSVLRSRGRAAHWTFEDSSQPTRRDQLQLRRWHRAATGAANDTPATNRFAKYDVKPTTPSYNDETYNQHLANPSWSKEETDYLLDTYCECGGKWPVIVDRYAASTPRTMEDLKSRYYSISAKMLSLDTPITSMTAPEYTLFDTLQKFDPLKEASRKKLVEGHLHRPRNEVDEETVLLGELQRIMLHQATLDSEREVSHRILLTPSKRSH